ncbi:LuxR C-terminal-related transcriptional regulator [Serratia sp. NPDC078593]|uniref:LuxR C-terminal-related transcriptional regulator n=1 Tax=unclassified Serratia (in: enterobacteria) TaxID=2647522 RepID=UPI0037CD5F78
MLQIMNNERVLVRDTLLKKSVAWPDTNRYFYAGILGYCDLINTPPEKLKVMFVDFQLSNIRLFLEQDWLIYPVCHRVILVSDRYLLPLANYYCGRFNQIDSVIQASGGSEDIFNQINYVISGKKVSPPSKASLSTREMCLLRILTSGVSVRELADRLQLSPKTVYAIRQNMLAKMGLRKMKDIFLQAVPSAR